VTLPVVVPFTWRRPFEPSVAVLLSLFATGPRSRILGAPRPRSVPAARSLLQTFRPAVVPRGLVLTCLVALVSRSLRSLNVASSVHIGAPWHPVRARRFTYCGFPRVSPSNRSPVNARGGPLQCLDSFAAAAVTHRCSLYMWLSHSYLTFSCVSPSTLLLSRFSLVCRRTIVPSGSHPSSPMSKEPAIPARLIYSPLFGRPLRCSIPRTTRLPQSPVASRNLPHPRLLLPFLSLVPLALTHSPHLGSPPSPSVYTKPDHVASSNLRAFLFTSRFLSFHVY